MRVPLLSTKFRILPVRANAVSRPDLIELLDNGLDRKLILLSAPAGFGKSTLAAQWVQRLLRGPPPDTVRSRVAWLSLEEGENDYARFLAYLQGAFQFLQPRIEGLNEIATTDLLRLPNPMPEQVLVPLINQIAEIASSMVLVLDDYHCIDSEPAHDALAFLIENMPRNLHVVIATRHDPPLPLARLRAENEMIELRASDLRFTSTEATLFIQEAMNLDLSTDEIAALEKRTEGWPAGLQLAGMSLQGRQNPGEIIESFAGSHRHVADYLLEEVLRRQPEVAQRFLLETSILDRLCGSLCDAVTGRTDGVETLRLLERTNSFILPLDEERRWYRYHELFAELLQQQLRVGTSARSWGEVIDVTELHERASRWHEEQGMEVEAFRHAAASADIERAERLLRGGGMPLHFRGAAPAVLDWLKSLPRATLDARPSLWVTYAAASVFVGQSTGVAEKLDAAEKALEAIPTADGDTVGRIAAIRAMLAVPRNEVETIVEESQRALEYLHPDNRPVRTASSWTLGVAYEFQGDRASAMRRFSEIVANSRSSGNTFFSIASLVRLAGIAESDNHLHRACETYSRVLEAIGDAILPFACEAHLGLARIYYQWNDLEDARLHGKAMLRISRWIKGSDVPAACWVFAARLKQAEGDPAGADALLVEAWEFATRYEYAHRLTEIAAEQVKLFLSTGRLEAAARISIKNDIPLGQARVHLARGEPAAALTILEPLRKRALENDWSDVHLSVLVLQALALDQADRASESFARLEQALLIAEPEKLVRVFIDEGAQMARLLYEAVDRGIGVEYANRLLSQCVSDNPEGQRPSGTRRDESGLIEPLSVREIEVLQSIGKGLSNQEVGRRLFISPHTVKAHTRNIYAKLDAHNRTEAVARARALGLLDDHVN